MLDLEASNVPDQCLSRARQAGGHFCKERQHSSFSVTTISAAARCGCRQLHPDRRADLAVAAAAEDAGRQQHVGGRAREGGGGGGGGACLRRAGREHGRGRV